MPQFADTIPSNPLVPALLQRLIATAGCLLLCLGFAARAQTTTTVEYIHTDALGSPVAVTNEAGQVIERTQWEPYGAAIGKRSSTLICGELGRRQAQKVR